VKPPGVLMGIALLLGAAANASTGDYRFEREIEVAEAGWTRVALNGRILAQGYPSERFRVMSPDGEPVPHRVLTPREGFIRAQTVSLDEDAAGWTIVFDLGPTPVNHRELEVDLIRRTSARDCRLEGSPDLATWSFLGEATLFRLGEDGHLHRSALDYARADARYLRLRWPRAAGFPEFREVGVRPLPHPPGDPVVVSVGLRPEVSAPGASSYRLELPGDGLRIRTVVLEGLDGQHDHGYRLYRGVSQRWEVIAQGVIGAGEPPRFDVRRAPERSELRLELYVPAPRQPSLESVAVEVAPVWILFRAARAGTHTLRYGGEAVGPQPGIPEITAVGPVTDLRPGSREKALAVAAIPSRHVEPVRGTDSDVARTHWTIVPSGAQPGAVVRLEIPDEVRREVGSRTGRLRVLAADREVPYVLWTPAAPEPVVEIRGLHPRPVRDERYRRVRIEREEIGPLLSQIEILVETGDLGSRVGLEFPTEQRPGVESQPVVLWGEWTCGESEALPCRVAFDGVPAQSTGIVDLLIETRRDTPEPSLRVRAWTPRPTIVFVLPESDELTLARLHGRRIPGVRYSLGDHAAALFAGPWTEVSLDLVTARDARARREKLMRIALFAVLAVGGIALLWILARNLRGAGGAEPE
jgi:hypothetical protein